MSRISSAERIERARARVRQAGLVRVVRVVRLVWLAGAVRLVWREAEGGAGGDGAG